MCLGGKKGKLNLSMSVLSSNDFHCLLRVIVKALISLWLQCTNFKGAVFFCLNPAPSSSMLFVKTRLFPSLHVRILKIPFSFFLVSTCRQSEKGWANAETEQAKGYQNNQAANICWQLLDNICLPLFEEKACCQAMREHIGIWEVIDLVCFIKGAHTMHSFSAHH